jgi:hypothetical protein
MKKLIEFLKGKKTYVVGLLMAFGTFAQAVGWIDTPTWEKVMGILAALGIVALRAGINKVQ